MKTHQAYHIRTVDPLQPDSSAEGVETFDLDSIYLPQEQFVIGLANKPGMMRNTFVVLNGSEYSERAQAIVDNNRGGVKGDVISKFSLDDAVFKALVRTGHEWDCKPVVVSGLFDGSTDSLVKALSEPESYKQEGWKALYEKMLPLEVVKGIDRCMPRDNKDGVPTNLAYSQAEILLRKTSQEDMDPNVIAGVSAFRPFVGIMYFSLCESPEWVWDKFKRDSAVDIARKVLGKAGPLGWIGRIKNFGDDPDVKKLAEQILDYPMV